MERREINLMMRWDRILSATFLISFEIYVLFLCMGGGINDTTYVLLKWKIWILFLSSSRCL